jgi:glycine/D-amino acid oxidase-like deaminating enzyme
MEIINGGVSFWHASMGYPQRRAPLAGPLNTDVCIVGAGFTGLWTAYYLKMAAPSLEIAVLEKTFAGYGASGRNGGWLTAAIAGSAERYAKRLGVDAVRAQQSAMIESIDEVIRVAGQEGIDADVVKGGELSVACSASQLARLRESVAAGHRWGIEEELLSAPQLAERINVVGALGGAYTAHGARVHPAKLVRGLADVVSNMGVTIYESTAVSEIRPHQAHTAVGTVTANYVVRATEGFTADLKNLHRLWIPMNSSMIVTEPLSSDTWDEIGWQGFETLGDAAHMYMYAQRTADNRIAIGGRGSPYLYGSQVDRDGHTNPRTISELRSILYRMFPSVANTPIDHAWSGVLGVPRDWCSTVGVDKSTGLGWAGGYVGHGVATTNLAGRTLRDLILSSDTPLTRLPWVDWKSRKWEPEPLRWLGVHSMYTAYRAADRAEFAGRATTSPIAKVANIVAGR